MSFRSKLACWLIMLNKLKNITNEEKSQKAIFFGEMQMATFSSCTFTSCRALRIAAESAKFQIVICPTDIAKWSIWVDTRRAVRQMRRSQHVPVQLFVHCKWLKLQAKDNEGDECYCTDGKLEERRGIRRQLNSSGN